MSLKFKIYSFMKTDCTRQRQHLFKLCSIKRVRSPTHTYPCESVTVLITSISCLNLCVVCVCVGLLSAVFYLWPGRIRDQDGRALYSSRLSSLP
jgi:hypothetical protein